MPNFQLLKQNPNSQVVIYHLLELKITLTVAYFPFSVSTSMHTPADVGITPPSQCFDVLQSSHLHQTQRIFKFYAFNFKH